MPFVFYDTETTGSDPVFDQILQFGAIRTDDDLTIVDRFDTRCRLLPHMVPSPEALLVTGLTAGQIVDPALASHFAMVRDIRARLMSWSPAVFAGYNSLEFDEMLLRQAFYQTLHPPYLTNSNGNSRADILQIVLAANVFEPSALSFTRRPDGKPSFRLDQLAPANGFQHANAHEAVADVEATIHIARCLKAHVPAFWDHAVRLGRRSFAIDYALAEPLRLYTEFHYNRPHHWLVAPLAIDPGNPSQVVSYDLAIDPETVAPLDDAALVRRLVTTPKPLRAIKANACPMILPWARGEGLVSSFDLGESELRRRRRRLDDDAALRERLLSAQARIARPYPVSPHVEDRIYESFPTAADQRRMESFQRADWAGRGAAIATFDDDRIKELALRLVHAECPDVLDAESRVAGDRALKARLLVSDKAPWLTLPHAIAQTDELLEHAGSADAARLRDLRAYLVERQAWAASLS